MKCNKIKNKNTDPINKLLRYLSARLKTVGVKLAYSALLLYYAYDRADTPNWAKNIILGSLAYLVSPFDSIPDLTPFLGFTDDFGVLSFGLVTIACYIDAPVREKAKAKINSFFKVVDEEDLLEVDAKL
ncbi:MAG: YkvA family protein [Saprospiraceae bacterium]|nr:YkvA family protein [Saprospiraceae bacterium]